MEAATQCDGNSITFDEINAANTTISIPEMYCLCEHFHLISKDGILKRPEVRYIANAVLVTRSFFFSSEKSFMPK